MRSLAILLHLTAGAGCRSLDAPTDEVTLVPLQATYHHQTGGALALVHLSLHNRSPARVALRACESVVDHALERQEGTAWQTVRQVTYACADTVAVDAGGALEIAVPQPSPGTYRVVVQMLGDGAPRRAASTPFVVVP